MTDEAPYLSVVIPAYNEEDRLSWALPALLQYLQERPFSFEVIVVNDGSEDRTITVVEKVARDYRHLRLLDQQPNQGKGAAVRAGMLAARGQYVLFTDADQSTPITELDKLLHAIENDGYHLAIGSRGVQGARVEQSQAWYRALAGKLFGIATQCLAIRGIADTQCGFKCMPRAVAQKIFSQVTSNTAIFDIEMLVVATREGYRVAELPVKWVHDPDTRIPYNLCSALQIWAELFRIHRVQNLTWPVKVQTRVSDKNNY